MLAKFLEELVTSAVDFLDRRPTLRATGLVEEDEPIIRNMPIQPFGFVYDCIDNALIEEEHGPSSVKKKYFSYFDDEFSLHRHHAMNAGPDYRNDPLYSWHPMNIYYSFANEDLNKLIPLDFSDPFDIRFHSTTSMGF